MEDKKSSYDFESSESIEDYLTCITRMENDGEPVTVSAIAEHLNVKKPSVSQMLAKMRKLGLCEHDSYDYVKLSQRGKKHAKKLLFRHRVIELFLTSRLGRLENEVHEEAHRLEHAFSDQSIKAIFKMLGRPGRGTHGETIAEFEE